MIHAAVCPLSMLVSSIYVHHTWICLHFNYLKTISKERYIDLCCMWYCLRMLWGQIFGKILFISAYVHLHKIYQTPIFILSRNICWVQHACVSNAFWSINYLCMKSEMSKMHIISMRAYTLYSIQLIDSVFLVDSWQWHMQTAILLSHVATTFDRYHMYTNILGDLFTYVSFPSNSNNNNTPIESA